MKELKDYKEIIHKCSKCGLCQSVCPPYLETGNECTVSRGQFIMLRGIINGDLKMNKNINKYLALILASTEKKFVYLRREEAITSEIFSIINKMYEENSAQDQNYNLFVEGYMNVLLGTLYRNNILKNIEQSYDKDAVRKIWPTIEYIEANYNKEMTLEKLASTLNMNREYFCRIFKKATEITPTEYIKYVRVWKAENLLTTTQNSILEISMEVGFSSVSYFNRVFKKLRGTTPSAYRNIIYAKNKLM